MVKKELKVKETDEGKREKERALKKMKRKEWEKIQSWKKEKCHLLLSFYLSMDMTWDKKVDEEKYWEFLCGACLLYEVQKLI